MEYAFVSAADPHPAIQRWSLLLAVPPLLAVAALIWGRAWPDALHLLLAIALLASLLIQALLLKRHLSQAAAPAEVIYTAAPDAHIDD